MSESSGTPIPKVVVVDDDPEILKLIAMLLRRIGAEAWTFVDGSSVLTHLETQIPDLILLDLMLPDINGFDVLSELRAQPRFDRVPILILSAKADAGTIRQGLDRGADGYLTKPYIANTLIDKVRLMLQSERTDRP